MCIYHCHVKPIQRSKGRTATACAAYRAGAVIVDNRTGLINDYSRKKGVDYSEIFGTKMTRSELWNTAEQSEKRKDATVAREYEIALPVELKNSAKIEIARQYSIWLKNEYGCAVDLCIHDINSHNPHAHVLTSTRAAEPNTLGEKVAREWSGNKRKTNGIDSNKKMLSQARLQLEIIINNSMNEAKNFIDQNDYIPNKKWVDHRSHIDRGIYKIPTQKEGQIGSKFEGDRKTMNQEIREINQKIENLQGGISSEIQEIREQQKKILEVQEQALNQMREIRRRLKEEEEEREKAKLRMMKNSTLEEYEPEKEQLEETEKREATNHDYEHKSDSDFEPYQKTVWDNETGEIEAKIYVKNEHEITGYGDDEIVADAIVHEAERLGWENIEFEGSEKFVRAGIEKALEKGMEVTTNGFEQYKILEEIKNERSAAEHPDIKKFEKQVEESREHIERGEFDDGIEQEAGTAAKENAERLDPSSTDEQRNIEATGNEKGNEKEFGTTGGDQDEFSEAGEEGIDMPDVQNVDVSPAPE